MKTLISTTLLLLALSLSALAQTPNRSSGQGYLFVAPGMADGISRVSSGGSLHIGGGAEAFVYKGLGVGAEIGAVRPFSEFSYVFGLGSVNLSYHFLPSDTESKLEPFVSVGYTIFFRAGVTHGGHAGFGVNRWLNKNVALRFEVRDNVEGGHGHLLGFRIGVTLR